MSAAERTGATPPSGAPEAAAAHRPSDRPTNLVLDEEAQRIVVAGNGEAEARTRRVGEPAVGERPPEVTPLDLSGLLAPRNLAGVTLQGRYRLEHILGSGGMGDVYVGRHLALDMPIAVKVTHRHIAAVPEFVARFRREAHAASKLHHRNVVRVLDFGSEGELLFIVMELLHGESLGEWLTRLPAPPPLADVRDIMLQLIDAFDAAHALGIVHRDLKPDNVFLTEESDGRRVVKVVDFGLARLVDSTERGPTLTEEGVVSGTPEYMSPEQCQSLSVGPSTDLYAIGCVLTTLLQLSPPFRAESSMAVMTRQMFWPAPSLTRPPSSEPVPPLLERLRLDLLAKSPAKRPADIAHVRTRFLEAMSPEATALRLPTRKGEEPTGTRSQRVPHWEGAAEPGDDPRAQPEGLTVGLVRLSSAPGGAHGEIAVGLAAHGIILTPLAPDADLSALALVVLDAGAELEHARGLIRRWSASHGPRVVLCAAGLSTEQIGQLISVGVADIVSYPVDVDVLLRKLRRLGKRRR